MKFRISEKRNVNFNNDKSTSYIIEEYKEDEFGQGSWHYLGQGFADGYDASDSICINDFFI